MTSSRAFNFYSHGSQHLYPTYIQVDKGLSPHLATVTTIIGNCGAIAGCSIGGYVSQYLGRRLTIIMLCCFCCAMLPRRQWGGRDPGELWGDVDQER